MPPTFGTWKRTKDNPQAKIIIPQTGQQGQRNNTQTRPQGQRNIPQTGQPKQRNNPPTRPQRQRNIPQTGQQEQRNIFPTDSLGYVRQPLGDLRKPTNPTAQLPTEQERILNQIDEKLKHINEAENKPTCEKSRISFPEEISKIVTSSSAEAKKNKLSKEKLDILIDIDNKLQMWIEEKKKQTNIEINDVLKRLTEEINTLLERWYIQCFIKAVDEAIPKKLRSATASYFGGSYENVNTLLRNNWERDGIKRYRGRAGDLNYKNDTNLIGDLNNAFSHAPAIPYPITVWRGTGVIVFNEGTVNAKELLSNSNQYEDKVFYEAGYMSTSYNREHAVSFVKDGILLEIQVPAGKRAIAATQTTEHRAVTGTQLRHEDEIVFPPGQKIQIESITTGRKRVYDKDKKKNIFKYYPIVKGKLL